MIFKIIAIMNGVTEIFIYSFDMVKAGHNIQKRVIMNVERAGIMIMMIFSSLIFLGGNRSAASSNLWRYCSVAG